MRRWWGGLRVAVRVARRDVRRHRGRAALVVALVGLPVLAVAGGSTVLQSGYPTDVTYARFVLGDEAQARVGAVVAPGLTQDAAGLSGASSSYDPAQQPPPPAEQEQALRGILPAEDDLVRVVSGSVEVSVPGRAVPNREVWETGDDPALASVLPVASGARPTTAGEAALRADLLATLGVGLGDRVTLTRGDEAVEVTVVGRLGRAYRAPAVVVAAGTLYPSDLPVPDGGDATAPQDVWWYVVGPEPVTWRDVQRVNLLGAIVTSRAVVADPPPDPDRGTPAGPVSDSVVLVAAVAAIAVVEAVLLVGPAFAVGARRSERRLALLAAVGGERRTLRQVVFWDGVVLGGTAAVVGAGLGVALAAVVRLVVHAVAGPYALPDLRVSWTAVAGGAAAGIVMSVAAAWHPAHRAGRVDVVAALGGRRAEARPRRGTAVVGCVVAVLGAVVTLVGAVRYEGVLLVGGIVALEVGLVLAAGGVVTLVGRLAPRLGVAGRFALRDAARQRSRTAPAVAAVMAAITGLMAAAVAAAAEDVKWEATYSALVAEGRATVGQYGTAPSAETLDRARDSVLAHLPVREVVPVALAVPAEGTVEGRHWLVQAARAPGQDCPPADDERQARAQRDDPRCRFGNGGIVGWANGGGALVDDGTVVAATGLPGSARAAAALAAGRVVVADPLTVLPDGTVRVTLQSYGQEWPPDTLAETTAPATVVDMSGNQYDLVLPPAVAADLGVVAEPAGFVVDTLRPPTSVEVAAVTSDLSGTALSVRVEQGRQSTLGLVLLVLLAAATLVGLGATGMSVALAAVEVRPDLATLAAVGAAPGVRRRVTAAQAGVVATIGSVLGVGGGLLLGVAIVLAQMNQGTYVEEGLRVVVPWPTVGAVLVGIPVLAVAGGHLLSRSRLPMVRRAG